MENKDQNCSTDDSCKDGAADDEVKTADLKKAVNVLNDETAPDHHKKKADSLLAATAQEAKKAEAFTPKKPDVPAKDSK